MKKNRVMLFQGEDISLKPKSNIALSPFGYVPRKRNPLKRFLFQGVVVSFFCLFLFVSGCTNSHIRTSITIASGDALIVFVLKVAEEAFPINALLIDAMADLLRYALYQDIKPLLR